MLEMSKNHLQYPFATFYDHLHKAGSTSASMPAGLSQGTKLPVIPTATGAENIPRFSSKEALGALRPIPDDAFEADDRIKMVESRLGASEKSNSVLLQEVIRLQGELRAMIRRNEEDIKNERVSRLQIEGSMQMVNDLIAKLSARIKAAEDKILEEKSALSSLVTHTKGVEQAVVASQQNLSVKKDVESIKIKELTLQLNEVQRNREQLEKLIYNLTEELRTLRMKVDNQTMELSGTVSDLKLRARRLEEENKIQLDALRKQGDLHNNTETSTTHLRGQIESRLSELRDVIMELRSRQDQEVNDRRSFEQQVHQKVNTMQQDLADQNRKREEAMHAMDMIHREKEHSAENDKLRLQGKLTETMEELNKRMLTKEIKLREELQEKCTHLERLIHTEQQVRQKYETSLREEGEKRWHGLKKLNNEEMTAIRETFQSERQKNKEAVQKLDESISLIEKQFVEQKRQTDKVVAAEIKSRKLHEKSTNEKIDHLNEKLSVVAASLQSSIGGVSGNFAAHTDKLRSEVRSSISASEQAGTRAIGDMDVRLVSLKQKVSGLEEQLNDRISEATAVLAENLRERIETITLWQDVTSQTIRELSQSIQGIPNEVYAVEEKQKLLKSEVDSRLITETDSRIREIESLRHEVSLLKNRRQPQTASVEDIQEIQASVRKLAESVQTVKTVLGMKLQSEQKLREDDIKELQEEVQRLRRKLDPNAPGRNYPRNYVSNYDDDEDDDRWRNYGRGDRGHGGRDDRGHNDRDSRRDDRGQNERSDRGHNGRNDNRDDRGHDGRNDDRGQNGRNYDRGHDGRNDDRDDRGHNGRNDDRDDRGHNGRNDDRDDRGQNGRNDDRDDRGHNGRNDDRDDRGHNDRNDDDGRNDRGHGNRNDYDDNRTR